MAHYHVDVGVNTYVYSESTAKWYRSSRKFANGRETLSMSPTSCDLIIARGTVNAFTPAQGHHVEIREYKVRLISRLFPKAVQKSQADRGRTPFYAERSAQAAGLSYTILSRKKRSVECDFGHNRWVRDCVAEGGSFWK